MAFETIIVLGPWPVSETNVTKFDIINGQPSKCRTRQKHPEHSSTPTMPSVIIQQAIFWLQVSVKHLLAQSTHSDQSCRAKFCRICKWMYHGPIALRKWPAVNEGTPDQARSQRSRICHLVPAALRAKLIGLQLISIFSGLNSFRSRFCCRCLECWCQGTAQALKSKAGVPH